jgi:ornithine carbamoyltransferase
LHTILDLTKEEILKLIEVSRRIKSNPSNYNNSLKRKSILMLFEKPSLRTRVSFETGAHQMGGYAIFYSIKDSPLGKKENIHDTAKCLSRYVDIICARTHKREDILQLSKYSSVPVINMLDDFGHPCQILADCLTILEVFGRLDNIQLAYFGDCKNNVTYDLMRVSAIMGWTIKLACPEGTEYQPEEEVIQRVTKIAEDTGAQIHIFHNAEEAARGADIIYTDSWMSYGIPKHKETARIETFVAFQVTSEIMKLAKPKAIFMNCLPAQRGMEQTAEVIDGPQSVVFDQAENRLHIQKAIMLFLLNKI